MAGGTSDAEVRAFAPCHVTGIVVPETGARDPRARGSRGAGLVLACGVHATARWAAGRRTVVSVRGDGPLPLPISEEVARRLASGRPGRFTVELRHDLPVGQGFGTSAAGALATGLALAKLVRLPRARAVEVAHLADLFGGGGLGGVAAILGGGLELRTEPGIPPFGRVARVDDPRPVLVGVLGRPIPSPGLLSDRDALARFARAARLLDRFGGRPDRETFWEVAEEFTSRAGVCPRELATLLRALRRRGARAAQAMFGSGFFVEPPRGPAGTRLGRWIAGQRLAVRTVAIAARSARWLARAEPTTAPGGRLRPVPVGAGQAF